MDESFIRKRISELRMEKHISEYKMSLDLGHSKSYIQSISSGRSLPSMSEFLYICEICEYFGISPKEFFDDGCSSPLLLSELSEAAEQLTDADIRLLITLARRMQNMNSDLS